MPRHPPATLMNLAAALAASALLAGGCVAATGAVPAAAPLWRAEGGGFVAAPGTVDPRAPCQLLSVSLKPDGGGSPAPPPKLFGAPSPCQATSLYIGYLRGTLFVEGLDASGARLFVATGLNPLHQDVEAPPSSSGPGMDWRAAGAAAPVLTTTIRAPLTPALSKLRWYDVDDQNQPRLLGEMAWMAP